MPPIAQVHELVVAEVVGRLWGLLYAESVEAEAVGGGCGGGGMA